ncbi:MAG: hypothetical protein R3F55_05085 [Alphaproteobacteria bacterium]
MSDTSAHPARPHPVYDAPFAPQSGPLRTDETVFALNYIAHHVGRI